MCPSMKLLHEKYSSAFFFSIVWNHMKIVLLTRELMLFASKSCPTGTDALTGTPSDKSTAMW